MIRRSLVGIGSTLLAVAALAQSPTVQTADVPCLPNELNAPLTATVSPEVPGSSVRLYFRRLHPEGTFYYYIPAHPSGGGNYWTVFPKPENREQEPLTDEWWETLKDRDWMQGRDRQWLENWMSTIEHEAGEYYVSVHDAQGNQLSRSPIELVEIWDPEVCRVTLTDQQKGWSENLTVGENAGSQKGKEVFHWLCDGIVTRIDPNNVYRADSYCRACVVAFIPPWIPPVAGVAAGAVIAASIFDSEDVSEPPTASPSQP